MIKCKNVCVKCGNTKIVHDINVDFSNGSVTAILGKNGCGKTAQLKAICGINKYTGSIIADEKEIADYKASRLARSVSMMPQALTQPHITIRRLVEFGRNPYTGMSGVLSPADVQIVNTAIAKANIEHIADKAVDKISGGERRKAFFAMILAQNTPNVLLDEPCANLDAEYTTKILGLINLLKRENKAIAAVFHNVNTALEVADKLVFMDDGYCIFEGSPQQAVYEHIPEKLFALKAYDYIDENGQKRIFYK